LFSPDWSNDGLLRRRSFCHLNASGLGHVLVLGMIIVLSSCDQPSIKTADKLGLRKNEIETNANAGKALKTLDETARNWVGHWEAESHDKDINIKQSEDKRSFLIEGYGTYGFDNPERVRLGALSTGQFAAQGLFRGAVWEFSVGKEDDPEPGIVVRNSHVGEGKTLDYDIAQDDLCKIRLTRIGSQMIAEDNMRCGGHNFAFTGAYFKSNEKVWWWDTKVPIDGFYTHD
jgi:hypothetical protein